jgi:hypothetical protein
MNCGQIRPLTQGLHPGWDVLVRHGATQSLFRCIEAVSGPQIRFKGKAQADEKAQHTWGYVSILKRLATQPLGLRWSLETASMPSSIHKSTKARNLAESVRVREHRNHGTMGSGKMKSYCIAGLFIDSKSNKRSIS